MGSQYGPPPAYESVMMSDADAAPSTSSKEQKPEPQFQFSVSEPMKQGDGISAYYQYRVRTKTSLAQYTSPNMDVLRRFRDFDWLLRRLSENNRGIIIPPLPEKSVVEKYQHTPGFLKQRRAALERFLIRVGAHPELANSSDLRSFLQDNDGTWQVEMARANAAYGGGAKKKLAGAVAMFRELGNSGLAMISGSTTRAGDEEEDVQYLKVREYVFQLEEHLADVHRKAGRLVGRQDAVATALSDFGSSMGALGHFEGGQLAGGFSAMGDTAQQLARDAHAHAAVLSTTLEAPLKEFVRLVKSAKTTMADRGAALAAVSAAKGDVAQKRSKLSKLRGLPGVREDKVSEVEQELNSAQIREESTQAIFDGIATRMALDFARFQAERADEMAELLLAFVEAQADAAAHTATTWRSMLPESMSAASDNDGNNINDNDL